MKPHTIIRLAAILGALAVAMGAFGAHALNDFLIETNRLDTYETAVKYHFYHTLALLLIALFSERHAAKILRWSAILMVAGIIIFSGSLYTLCFTGITILGAITPIGGVCLIAGWLTLLFSIPRSDQKTS